MNTKFLYTITNKEHDWRLDKAISSNHPNISLRMCRRLIQYGFITLNGFQTKPGIKVKTGQNISIEIPQEEFNTKNVAPLSCTILTVQNSLLAMYKPSGIHTEHIKGSPAPSLEKIFQKNIKKHPLLTPLIHKDYPLRLLNRLDQQTSGIVIGSLKKSGETLWKEAEQIGAIKKHYLTFVQGKILKPIIIKNMLYVHNTLKTKVSSKKMNNDTVRHTFVKPVKVYKAFELQPLFPEIKDNIDLTLVQCMIKKGMRHQIRAHLSEKGFPIVGDNLYGSKISSPFFLHHYQTISPEFNAFYLPNWFKRLKKINSYAFPPQTITRSCIFPLHKEN